MLYTTAFRSLALIFLSVYALHKFMRRINFNAWNFLFMELWEELGKLRREFQPGELSKLKLFGGEV
jgi:hypothetical protein